MRMGSLSKRHSIGANSYGSYGITTVDAVRAVGGDVIRTSDRSPYHATLTGLISSKISLPLTSIIPVLSKLMGYSSDMSSARVFVDFHNVDAPDY